jgi:hypothetical protein
MKSSKDIRIDASAQHMRIRIHALVDPLCGVIEMAADSIAERSSSPEVRREALRWKIDAVPAMREALFRPDPLAAILDAWALSAQMVDYFESGAGKRALGDWSSVAVLASRRLRSEIEAVASGFVKDGDITGGHAFIETWAEQHPIEHSIAGRESILNQVSEATAKTGLGARKALGSLQVGMDDLSRRVEVYADQLTRQFRWQVELFTLELFMEHELDRIVARVPELMDAAESAAALAETAPGLIAEERAAILEALHNELIAALAFLAEERAAILGHITDERVVVIEEVDRSRDEVLETVSGELRAIIEILKQERIDALADVEVMSRRTVDHAFKRVAQLLAAVVAVCLLAGAVALLVLRPRARAH